MDFDSRQMDPNKKNFQTIDLQSQHSEILQTRKTNQPSKLEKAFHLFNLIVNITGGAMIGPVSNFLPTKGEGTYLNLAWRFIPMTTWIFLVVVFQEIYECCKRKKNMSDTEQFDPENINLTEIETEKPVDDDKAKFKSISEMFRSPQYHLLVLAASICQIIIQDGIVWATLHTIQADASILTNVYGATLSLIYIIICRKLHKFEYAGTFLIVMFVIVVCTDPHATREGEKANIQADFLTLLVNLPFIVYFFLIGKLAKMVDKMMIYVLHQTIIQSFMLMVLAVWIDGAEYSNLSNKSIWGWLQKDQILYVSVVYGLICGVYGTQGAIFVVKHFPLIPLMNSYLLRPIQSQLMGCYLGIDNMPGIQTFIGVAGLICSIMFQKYGQAIREKEEKENMKDKSIDESYSTTDDITPKPI